VRRCAYIASTGCVIVTVSRTDPDGYRRISVINNRFDLPKVAIGNVPWRREPQGPVAHSMRWLVSYPLVAANTSRVNRFSELPIRVDREQCAGDRLFEVGPLVAEQLTKRQ